MAHLFLSATHRSAGKTTIAAGLCRALRDRGLAVQPFKKGPDYIDPMWLGAGAGRPCFNLDFHTMAMPEIVGTFARRMAGADIGVIEGTMGLHDGLDLDGGDSNAALATLLRAPVVLVVDASGMTRGIAPLILGYQAFDRGVRIAGVILNKIDGARHETKLRAVLDRYTDVVVLGAVHKDPAMEIVERHIGLMPTRESAAAEETLEALARGVARQIDLDRLLALAAEAGPAPAVPGPRRRPAAADVRLGIARDSAFGFYYPGDLEALSEAGAEIVFFDTLNDRTLPPVDGLFVGGGFPEVHMAALEANASLRADIRAAIDSGLPAYAECGGLMYLCRRLVWKGEVRAMAGVIAADAVMHNRPQGRGYVLLRETGAAPWRIGSARAEIAAHEFHYAGLENLEGSPAFAFEVTRGHGIDGRHDGLVHRNLLAGFAHLRDAEAIPWARRFVDFVRARKIKSVPTMVRTGSAPARAAAPEPRTAAARVAPRVFLVGAGPGDPKLLTLRAHELLRAADVVLYDRLVAPQILDLVRPGTTRIFAGKAARAQSSAQEEINDLLVRLARGGRKVVRLKGGDPFVFGRGSEEAVHLARNGISFEVVPGITAAVGCTARAGIPLTHRGIARAVTFVTGHCQDGKDMDLDWRALAAARTTLVIYMGLTNIARISRELIAAGLPGYTPAAAIASGTTPAQRTVLTTVADLPDCVRKEGLQAPTLLVIGEVVELAETLAWASAVTECGLMARA